MRIGILFHKNPLAPPTGIDLVRLRAIAGGLRRRGIETEIVAPIEKECLLEGEIPVRPLATLDRRESYDLVKASYHYSIFLLGKFRGPVVSRIVRVVDNLLPERDEPFRKILLDCQQSISDRASAIALNNVENVERWSRFYGQRPRAILVPTGCASIIPAQTCNPFLNEKPSVLFLGSLAAPRMVHMLNEAVRRLEGVCQVHLVGVNKTFMYGGDNSIQLSKKVIDHGRIPEDDTWDYIGNASIGLALATGPHPFDNDLSKILSYLRGGLPIVSEEPVANNYLIRETNFGKIVPYGDIENLVAAIRELIRFPPTHRQEVMNFMIREHSWEKRVDTYIELFETVLNEGNER